MTKVLTVVTPGLSPDERDRWQPMRWLRLVDDDGTAYHAAGGTGRGSELEWIGEHTFTPALPDYVQRVSLGLREDLAAEIGKKSLELEVDVTHAAGAWRSRMTDAEKGELRNFDDYRRQFPDPRLDPQPIDDLLDDVLRNDRQWFQQHPGIRERIRPVVQGEFDHSRYGSLRPEQTSDIIAVRVVGSPAGARNRIPLVDSATLPTHSDPCVSLEGLRPDELL